jgi:hypothetical protein
MAQPNKTTYIYWARIKFDANQKHAHTKARTAARRRVRHACAVTDRYAASGLLVKVNAKRKQNLFFRERCRFIFRCWFIFCHSIKEPQNTVESTVSDCKISNYNSNLCGHPDTMSISWMWIPIPMKLHNYLHPSPRLPFHYMNVLFSRTRCITKRKIPSQQ